MPSSSSSGEDNFCIASRTKKGKRGPVYMAKLVKEHTMKGTKLMLQFDDRCDPRGDNATTWRSYLCMLARSRVPITFSDWRKVPSHYKETLWRDATAIFDGCEPYKKNEMKAACQSWKLFKTRLAKEYIFGNKAHEDPLGEYKFLDKETWKTFKDQRLSEKAIQLRETNQELVKKNIYTHNLGRGGYRKLKEKIISEKQAELAAQEESVEECHSSSITHPERHLMWKLGRMKNGEFVTEASQLVATKIDELVTKSSQGQWSSQNPRHDILTEAIGTPEHKGRTRRVGTYIPWKVGLPITTSSGGKTCSSKTRFVPSDRISRHCPVDSDPWKDIPKGGKRCLLHIERQVGGVKQLVAIGRVVMGRYINFKPIAENDVRVKVDKAVHNGRVAALPTPHPTYSNVNDAVDHHVAWPKDLVVVDAKRYDEELYFSLPPTDDAFIDNLFIECRLLHELWKKLDKNIIFINDDNELFSDDYDIVVGDDEVKDLLELNALRNSSSELYLCYLHEQMIDLDIKFGFICPSLMAPSVNTNQRLATLVGRLEMPDRNQTFCYFLPYVDNELFHWMLCVIFPRQHKVLWFDSSREEGKDINPDVKDLVNVALDQYYKECGVGSSHRVEWKTVKCPRQPPGILCGYYVLRYIRDIINFVQANNGAEVEDIYNLCFSEVVDSYEEEKILEVRDEICRYLRNHVTTNYPYVRY